MKKCVSCQKDIPNPSVHCVFCGSKQPAGGQNMFQANAAVKTMMGYVNPASTPGGMPEVSLGVRARRPPPRLPLVGRLRPPRRA